MLLTVDDLDFYYNNRHILDNISFEVRPGRVVVVLGINGAGKSTLLRCLAGILAPNQGSVCCDGVPVSHLSRREAAQIFGYVPQSHGNEKTTVFESVLLGRRPHFILAPTKKDLEITENVLGRLGLEELAFMPVASLSGGQARKVSVARALAQKPALLLMDEPTNGLDMKSRLELAETIGSEVSQRDIAAVVATHDLPFALSIAHQLVLIKGRKVLAVVAKDDFNATHVKDVFGVEAIMTVVAGRKIVVPLAASCD